MAHVFLGAAFVVQDRTLEVCISELCDVVEARNELVALEIRPLLGPDELYREAGHPYNCYSLLEQFCERVTSICWRP